MNQKIEQLRGIIDNADKITFFTGAGISVASGIPDFRSIGGLYDEISKNGYSPEYLLSEDYFKNEPEGFIRFCHQYLLFADKEPNVVHQWIAQLERDHQSLGVITQNIDGLHSDAGSTQTDELHGTLNRFYCLQCNQKYTKPYVIDKQLHQCEMCGSIIRPDIVLYGETLNQDTIFDALHKIKAADTLVVLGSSLVVQPAAGLISNFDGKNLIIINRDPTPYDNDADLVIQDDMISVINNLNDIS
ncbi:NAD-dependent protein deacylase [Staphylococcus nepalensis]|uniref:protein acetyllysine N-acetyltransferase n=1 Tax=Staphylococcus nepalensis TaxID=214473 RepID=A0ABS3L3V4_9STAP|nr:NAD-dependent protein deacylase [Staphylococcus nepalensis]MBO1212251.1 NAD-dependent protein deacylase [Staphylococcus nepalensis]MBO1217374.1 NAD-dependent protein deacylase [Staphylococcus nepalensis]MBO1227728.1 NAD-dependent protein deacylase [Staphylococcus nepalensis]MBO1235374.1 NAD-dependent protein deacylase [Staphylococcus nepalensis]MBO1236613.1 NAD-dependent protein deacylase [Staphylococcus nepalensis]